jgi:hypothetical protein
VAALQRTLLVPALLDQWSLLVASVPWIVVVMVVEVVVEVMVVVGSLGPLVEAPALLMGCW